MRITKATLYYQGGYGNSSVEVRDLEVTVAPWAQYSAAIHVTYVPKGARKRRGFVQSYSPSLIVLDGWDHPKPENFTAEKLGVTPGVKLQEGKYSAHDSRWLMDLKSMIEEYTSKTGTKVHYNFMGHDPHGQV